MSWPATICLAFAASTAIGLILGLLWALAGLAWNRIRNPQQSIAQRENERSGVVGRGGGRVHGEAAK